MRCDAADFHSDVIIERALVILAEVLFLSTDDFAASEHMSPDQRQAFIVFFGDFRGKLFFKSIYDSIKWYKNWCGCLKGGRKDGLTEGQWTKIV